MFVPEPGQPAHLLNHGNEYLHYEDDWYIVGSKPDSYIVVYYKGNNDAWRGYGGAVVYTKADKFPQELVPEVSAAVEQVGLKWADFKITDNTCGPHPAPKSLVQQVEEEVAREGAELGGSLRSFGRGFTVLEEEVEAELAAEGQVLQRDLAAAEALLEQVCVGGEGAAGGRDEGRRRGGGHWENSGGEGVPGNTVGGSRERLLGSRWGCGRRRGCGGGSGV